MSALNRGPSMNPSSNGPVIFAIRPTETLLGVLIERYGDRSWVVGTDYPHADTMGSWPHTVEVIKGRKDLSPAAQDAILGGNALRLFDMKE